MAKYGKRRGGDSQFKIKPKVITVYRNGSTPQQRFCEPSVLHSIAPCRQPSRKSRGCPPAVIYCALLKSGRVRSYMLSINIDLPAAPPADSELQGSLKDLASHRHCHKWSDEHSDLNQMRLPLPDPPFQPSPNPPRTPRPRGSSRISSIIHRDEISIKEPDRAHLSQLVSRQRALHTKCAGTAAELADYARRTVGDTVGVRTKTVAAPLPKQLFQRLKSSHHWTL